MGDGFPGPIGFTYKSHRFDNHDRCSAIGNRIGSQYEIRNTWLSRGNLLIPTKSPSASEILSPTDSDMMSPGVRSLAG